MGNNDAAPSSSRGSSTTSYSLDGNNARVFSPRGIDVGFVPHGLGPCFSPYEIWTQGNEGNGRRGIRQQVFLTCFSPKLSICCFIASLILQHVRHRFSFPIRQKVLFWLIRLCSCLAKATLRSIRTGGPTTEVVKESRKHAAQLRDAKKPYAPLLCDRKQRGQSFTKMSVKNGSIE